MKRVAVLNKDGHLVGAREIGDSDALREDEVDQDPGDLPLNGTYKRVVDENIKGGGVFVLLGRGFASIKNTAPYSSADVLAEVIDVLGAEAGPKAKAWRIWYAGNLAKREEENRLRLQRKKGEVV